MTSGQGRTRLKPEHQAKATPLTGLSATPLSFWSWTPTASLRDKELALSARRSHNARVNHARRKKELEKQNNTKAYLHNTESTDLTTRLSARPALLEGNSDPFDSFPMHVSPHVTRMVHFARDSYYPSMTLKPWRRLRRHRKQQEGRLSFEIGSSSADCTIAHIASYGAALVRILPVDARHELEKTWLEVRSLALRRLRESLAMHGSADPFSVIIMQQCLYLYKCDVEARLFSSARIHGAMLRQLLKSTPANPTTISLFLSVMGNVLQFVCFQLEAPVMTYNDWHPHMWRTFWTKAENILATRSQHLTARLHDCINSPYVREVLSRFRIYLATPSFGPNPSTQEDTAQLSMISLWPVTRIVDDTVKLFAHFQTITARYKDQLRNKHLPPTNLWEALTTLSTLCTIRHYLNSPRLDNSNISLRDASSTLAPLLRRTLVDYLRSTPEHELEQHAEVLFWVYFTGALYEQRSNDYRQQILKLESQVQTPASGVRRSTVCMEDSSHATSSTRASAGPNIGPIPHTSTSPSINTSSNTSSNTSLDKSTIPSISPNMNTPTYSRAGTKYNSHTPGSSLTPNTNSNSINTSNVDESTEFYFTKHLARQAQRLQLQRWRDAQHMLARVAYCEELLDVAVEEWWEKLFQ